MSRRLILVAWPLLAAAEPLQFVKHIRPILEQHCTGCHNHGVTDKPAVSGGLALDSYDAVVRGSKKPVVAPGNPGESELARRLESSDPAIRMPRGGTPLSPETVATVRQWISEGAKEGDRPLLPDAPAAPGVRIAVKPTNVFIPFGSRKPIESTPALDRKEKTTILDIPGAIVVDEDARTEKIAVQKYSQGLTLKIGPLAPVTAVAFTPDGGSLLVGAFGRVVEWDLARKSVVRELDDMAGGVNSLLFSPDGKLLSVAGGKPFSPGEIRLYDAHAGLKPVATLAAHKEVILNQAFSPDSKRLATVSFDKTVEIWDIADRKRIASIQDHSDTVQCVAFDRQGKTLATGGMDRIVKLSDAVSGKGFLTINPELRAILTLAFSPDGKFLVTSGESPEIRWWDVTSIGDSVSERGWIPMRKLPGHTAPVYDLRFSPDGTMLATAGADHSVRLWDGSTGRPLRTLIDADDLQYGVAFAPDSKQIAAAGGDGLTRVWDAKTGALRLVLIQKQMARNPLEPKKSSEWLAVEPGGRYAASSGLNAILLNMGQPRSASKVEHATNNP